MTDPVFISYININLLHEPKLPHLFILGFIEGPPLHYGGAVYRQWLKPYPRDEEKEARFLYNELRSDSAVYFFNACPPTTVLGGAWKRILYMNTIEFLKGEAISSLTFTPVCLACLAEKHFTQHPTQYTLITHCLCKAPAPLPEGAASSK